MELFERTFLYSIYKIKLIGYCYDYGRRALIFRIHGELYCLYSSIEEFEFKKLELTKNTIDFLNTFKEFQIGNLEIKQFEKDGSLYMSNIFSIRNGVVKMHLTLDEVSYREFIHYITNKEQKESFIDLNDIKIICK